MLTLVESISLAGDRAKQNDDQCGARGACAWVIDGATDLHDAPITDYASDASWIASHLNGSLHEGLGVYEIRGADEDVLRGQLSLASESAASDFKNVYFGTEEDRSRLPTAAMLMVSEVEARRIVGIDLGDCRCFALDDAGASFSRGGLDRAADKESEAAAEAAKRGGGGPLLRDARTIMWLRQQRAVHNTPGGYWVFGLQPECADHARAWTLELIRPAYLLLCTDGFSALVDRYGAYDPGGLVRTALSEGLQELGRQLRQIEAADAGGASHPRWKRSDDATAMLLRLT